MQKDYTVDKQVEKSDFRSTRGFEKKFPFSMYDTDFVLDILHHTCLPDRKYPENYISTVYYETEDLSSYYENLNGDTAKAKLRVRWYGGAGGPEQEPREVFVEIKLKEGLEVKKARRRVHLSNASFNSSNLTGLLWEDQLNQISTELGWKKHGRLYPLVLIQYKRSRFLDPFSGARIALDRRISVVSVNTDLLPTAQPTRLNSAILEIKGGNRLPLVVSMIRGLVFRWESFSKYCICLEACIKEGH